MSHAQDEVLLKVKHEHSGAIRDVVGLLFEIYRITGEAIFSRDLTLVLVQAGDSFDSDRMLNQWADRRKAHRDIVGHHQVLCTTGLGLMRVVGRDRKAVFQERDKAQGVVLLKTEVVLTTMLEEIHKE